MSLINTLYLKDLSDTRGGLVALESGNEIPFEIKRVYYIFNLDSQVERGFHAHKELRQVAVVICGSCEILMDDGSSQEVILLDSPFKGLIVDKMIWHEMRSFSKDCVLLVMASDLYDEKDYIRNYDDFIQLAKK